MTVVSLVKSFFSFVIISPNQAHLEKTVMTGFAVETAKRLIL